MKIKHTIPKQKESYNRYCVFFRYQSMQEKLPVASSVDVTVTAYDSDGCEAQVRQ